MVDLGHFIQEIEANIARHALGQPGAYRRWLWQNATHSRDLGLNPYGCADAANILYTIGRFPRDPQERQSWIATLHSLQDSQTGMFREATHHPIHTTAHCIAALELFDAAPRYPLTELARLSPPGALEAFLEHLEWAGNPWSQSHQGAGVYAALVLAGEVSPAWQERYFAWLWRAADPQTGLFRQGCIAPIVTGGTCSLFPHLAGTFHYLFNHAYARRPLRYPDALIDTCLELWQDRTYPLGAAVGFAEVDWVYCLSRSLRQSGHRFADCHRALEEFASQYIPFLTGLDMLTHDGLNDLHSLFGVVCALAELQQALPGLLRTARPLRLVLDRRPFI